MLLNETINIKFIFSFKVYTNDFLLVAYHVYYVKCIINFMVVFKSLSIFFTIIQMNKQAVILKWILRGNILLF